MDEEEILQLVQGGELDPGDIADFRELDYEIQKMVSNGEITIDEALEIGG